MKFGVVIFPGSNCDHDLIHALEKVHGQEVVELWHKDTDLKGCDFIFLPGGFSYGDYLRSGALARFSPVMQSIAKFAAGGGFVMGICNGFQILCEAGLLPGALIRNSNLKFICKNIYIKAETTDSLVTSRAIAGKPLKIPIAHGEGNYYAEPEVIKRLNDNKQVLFRYCGEDAEFSEGTNVNGSLDHIAGICNEGRNVFGMMPHPERAVDQELYNTDGNVIFQSILHGLTTAVAGQAHKNQISI
jgi:phosphoribosylformylglycinamidine synthase I